MRAQKPEELFDANGKLIPELKELAPTGHAADERESARQRRTPQKASAHARFPRIPAEGRKARTDRSREHAPPRSFPARCHESEHGSLPRLRSGREHIQQAAGHLRGQQEVLDRRILSRKTRTVASWLPTGASSRCSASTRSKACSKAICSRAGTASSLPTKPSFT